MTTLDPNKLANTARDWWGALQPREIDGGSTLRGDRAALAKLRRAASPFEAAAEPETIKLFHKLGLRDPANHLSRVAVLAAVLAHVRNDDKERVARSLGPPSGGEPSEAIYSQLRLRRLLASKGDDELLIAFRRVVAILRDKANVRDLATQIFNWDRDEVGDRTRMRFAFDYHSAGVFAPGRETETAATASKDKG